MMIVERYPPRSNNNQLIGFDIDENPQEETTEMLAVDADEVEMVPAYGGLYLLKNGKRIAYFQSVISARVVDE